MKETDLAALYARFMAFRTTVMTDVMRSNGVVSVPTFLGLQPELTDEGTITTAIIVMMPDGAATAVFFNEELAIHLRDGLCKIYPPKPTIQMGV